MHHLKLSLGLFCCLLYLPGLADNKPLDSHPSPFLRSHASDPIKWQLISKKVLSRTKETNRPIFISSGYQACYWCYRMKVDTFSNKKLAKTINRSFLPLLIDRELEPQLDQQLQLFIETQRGFGGWPLNVILTPQGHPVAGFSYSSAEALGKAIEQFLATWKSDPQRVTKLARVAAEVRFKRHQRQDTFLVNINPQGLLRQFLNQVSAASDDKHGGFGDHKKFPHSAQLSALLDLYSLNPDKALGEFLKLSLDNILQGALRDQLGGGFFRYVESRDWKNPHFEQMLYTQALLGKLFIRAGQALDKPEYIIAGRDTLLNMVKKFRDKNGLYHASLSALDETDKAGGYYLWSRHELDRLLGENWQMLLKNLLSNNPETILPRLLAGTSTNKTKAILLKQRSKRVQPVDNKKLLAWQGLVLSGLAYGAQLSAELADAGKALADKILQLVAKQQLQDLVNDGTAESADTSLEALVYIAQGLLDWWQVSGDETLRKSAGELLLLAHRKFYKNGRWQQTNQYGFLDSPPSLAMADTQLASPSATWLSLAWALSAREKDPLLAKMAGQVGKRLPQALHENAFFHATLLSTLIAREWRLRNNQAKSSTR